MKVHRMLAKGMHRTNDVRSDVFLVVSIWRNNSSDVEVASDIGHRTNWIVSYVIWEASGWLQSFIGHWRKDSIRQIVTLSDVTMARPMLAACSRRGFQHCIWRWRGSVWCGIGQRWTLGAQRLIQMASDTSHSRMTSDAGAFVRCGHCSIDAPVDSSIRVAMTSCGLGPL